MNGNIQDIVNSEMCKWKYVSQNPGVSPEDLYKYSDKWDYRMLSQNTSELYIQRRKLLEASHNWVWKPKCNDGTIGIRPRLDMKELGLTFSV